MIFAFPKFLRCLAISCLVASTTLSAQQKTIADSLLKLSEKDLPDSLRLKRYNIIGWNLSTNDPARSLEYAEKARVLAVDLQQRRVMKTDDVMRELGVTYNTLGSLAYRKGDYGLASKNFMNALRIFENFHDESRAASQYNNLGSMYVSLGNYKEATVYLQRALELRKKLCAELPADKDQKKSLAKTYNNLGSLCGDQGKLNEALAYFKQSLEIREAIGDKRGMAHTQSNIGDVYLHQENYPEADVNFAQALETFRKMNDQAGVVTCLNNIGLVSGLEKKFDAGIKSLNQAMEIEKELRFTDDLKASYENFAALYTEMGNYKLANDYLYKFMAMKDTLVTEKINKQTSELQEKYQSTKKQAQIDLLQQEQKNEELASSRQRLVIYSIIFVLIMVVLLAVVLWNRNMIRKRANRELGEQNKLIEQQKNETEMQKTVIEEKQKEILDSIQYARRIQRAVITSDEYIARYLPEYFTLYKPKDIVSGDFYWALHQNNRFYLLTGDCTGHGVPGAFMSLLMISILNEIVIERGVASPDLILNEARKSIIKALNPGGHEEAKDGMDCTLCVFDLGARKLEYAAANSNFYLVRNGELMLFPGDKMPVGKSPKDDESFTLRTAALQPGDAVYTLTDGMADQFGGPKGKKFKYKQLQELILRNVTTPMGSQKQVLEETIEEWRGPLEQVDDILVIGIRI
jgi:serine phosphatase RsbU (regulator of sigma subunit)/tetratricopeptide (TPR) repeat protein